MLDHSRFEKPPVYLRDSLLGHVLLSPRARESSARHRGLITNLNGGSVINSARNSCPRHGPAAVAVTATFVSDLLHSILHSSSLSLRRSQERLTSATLKSKRRCNDGNDYRVNQNRRRTPARPPGRCWSVGRGLP